MHPRKRPIRSTPVNQIPPPPPPPPPQFNALMFQAAVTAAVAQINSSDASGGGMGVNSRHGEIHPRT